MMLSDEFQNKEYRDAFVDAMIQTGIAFQIKALRKREDWSQKVLGETISTPQNVISRYENPDYDGFTLNTLKRLASAFDVALIVKFAPFGELVDMTKDRSESALAVSSYSMEKAVSAPPYGNTTATKVNTSTTPHANHFSNVVSLANRNQKPVEVGSEPFSELTTAQHEYASGGHA